MNLRLIWPFVEVIVILTALGFIIFRMWRTMKARAQNPPPRPATLAGRVKAGTMYALRLIGFTAGIFIGLVLFIMLERNIVETITETAPVRSEVNVPSNLGLDVEEVRFKSDDGLTMAGWYIPPRNGVTIILLHGYGNNRTSMIWHAGQLANAGYGVLMYDERASGESEGAYRSYGWEDTRDVAGAIRYIEARPDKGRGRIGIAGCSSGADIALASAPAQAEIGAIWADGASAVRAQDLPAPKNPMMGLMIAGQYLFEWMITVKLDIVPPAPLTERLAEIAPRPILFVGGGMEQPFIGSEANLFTLRYAELAGPNAQVWIISEATHCDGPGVQPEEYARRLTAFFDEAFVKAP